MSAEAEHGMKSSGFTGPAFSFFRYRLRHVICVESRLCSLRLRAAVACLLRA